MTRSMEATPANAAAGPSSTESRTSTMVSSRGPPHRKHQNGIASSKRRTSFDTKLTICGTREEGQARNFEGASMTEVATVLILPIPRLAWRRLML